MDAPKGVNRIDYAANFEAFYKDKQDGAPFCFWMGTREPHRPYDEGSGVRGGQSLDDVKLPGFLPAVEEIQSDFLDYYNEIEWHDAHLVRALEFLEAQGELDNTLVVVTSDNGMQIPRGITCLHDYGVRVPLAIRWGNVIEQPRVYDEFVNLIDLAPTFYRIAGVNPPESVTGRNLVPLLESQPGELGGEWRNAVVTGMERHTLCRPGELPYPSRAIRTHEYLYIRNYEPDRWPAGAPDYEAAAQGFYGDVDEGPTKTWFLDQADNPEYAREFALSFGKRPAEELYKLSDDPDQMTNLADAPEHAEVKTLLKSQMNEYLERTGDPRLNGESPWDRYPYYSNTQRQGKEPVTNPHVIPDD
jgi:N-sulfoglucosamine sulfohydrolase